MGGDLQGGLRERLIEFLKRNADCFAWSHEDVVRIDPEVITHKKNVNPNHLPVKKKHRKFAPKRNQVINEEVQNLLEHVR